MPHISVRLNRARYTLVSTGPCPGPTSLKQAGAVPRHNIHFIPRSTRRCTQQTRPKTAHGAQTTPAQPARRPLRIVVPGNESATERALSGLLYTTLTCQPGALDLRWPPHRATDDLCLVCASSAAVHRRRVQHDICSHHSHADLDNTLRPSSLRCTPSMSQVKPSQAKPSQAKPSQAKASRVKSSAPDVSQPSSRRLHAPAQQPV